MVQHRSPNKRKQEIQQAAAGLFLSEGFKDTTMEAIVKETSLSKGGVYHYYSNKTDILFDIMAEGNSYRSNRINETFKIDPDCDQTDLIAEVIVNKMLADNDFLPLYIIFLKEAQTNQKLKELLIVLKHDAIGKLSFIFDQLDPKYNVLLEGEFIMNLINSILLGSVILDAHACFYTNKEVLKEMMKVYIKLETEK